MSQTKSLEGKCESCMMPFKKDPEGINREHEKYCSYCFNDGKLTFEGHDVKEFKKAIVENMISKGESKVKANIMAFFAGMAPRWKKSI